MAKKDLKRIILDEWAGSRELSKFMRGMTLEEFTGYVTAMTMAQHHNISESPAEVLALVRQLIKDSNI